MRYGWRALEARYNGMATRERVLVAAGVLAVLCYAGYALFLGPALAEHQRAARETAALQAQSKTLDEALAGLARTAGPGAQRAYRDELRAQIEALDREMRGMQRTLVSPSEMPRLLRTVLGNNRRLKLLSLKNAPVEPLAPMAAPAAQAPAAQRVIYRHTVELRVSGSYADLHAYLVALEGMPWQMYWGRLDVETLAYPRLVATLTVHTLSLDKAWLSV